MRGEKRTFKKSSSTRRRHEV